MTVLISGILRIANEIFVICLLIVGGIFILYGLISMLLGFAPKSASPDGRMPHLEWRNGELYCVGRKSFYDADICQNQIATGHIPPKAAPDRVAK